MPNIILGLLEFGELLLFYSAIKRISLATTSLFIPIAAVFSLLGSAFFLHEHITAQHYLGFFFISVGLLLLSRAYVMKKSHVSHKAL